MANILWIEDEADKLWGLVKPLEKEGHKIIATTDGNDALQKIKEIHYDLIIIDIIISEGGIRQRKELEDYVGVNLLKQIRHTEKITTPIIVLTVVDDDGVLEEIRNIGVSKILRKGAYLPSNLKKEVDEILGMVK